MALMSISIKKIYFSKIFVVQNFRKFFIFFQSNFGKNRAFLGTHELFSSSFTLQMVETPPEKALDNIHIVKTSPKQPIFDLKKLDLGDFRVYSAFFDA